MSTEGLNLLEHSAVGQGNKHCLMGFPPKEQLAFRSKIGLFPHGPRENCEDLVIPKGLWKLVLLFRGTTNTIKDLLLFASCTLHLLYIME